MAQCVVLTNVNGVDVFTPSAAEPCTTLMLISPAEYGAFSVNPFNLTPEEGAEIAFLIVGVWVTALCIRALIRVIDGSAPTEAEHQ